MFMFKDKEVRNRQKASVSLKKVSFIIKRFYLAKNLVSIQKVENFFEMLDEFRTAV